MLSATSIRHWITGICLFISVVMLLCGLTVLASRLKEIKFILYWLGCAGFTGLAAVVAVIEILAIRRQSREVQKELIKQTLSKLERD